MRAFVIHGLVAALLATSASSVASARQAAPAEPPPLSAYGKMPSLEQVVLSPSGQRVAFVTVRDEQRVVALSELPGGARIGNANGGDMKLRDLRWIDEGRVLVTTSSTETLPALGIFREELYLGQVFAPAQPRATFTILSRNHNLLPIMLSPADIVGDEERSIRVRAFAPGNPDGIDLYRVDPANGRASLAEPMGRDVEDYVLGSDGRSVAQARYDERAQSWSLHLRQGNRMVENWRTPAPIDMPRLMGLGLNGDSVIVAAERPDLTEGETGKTYFGVNLETGAWRRIRFEFEPDLLLFHPVTRRLIGAGRAQAEGMEYVYFDAAAASLWSGVVGALPGALPALVSWSDDLRNAVVFTSGSGDSGTYHLVNMSAGSISQLGQAYPAIPAEQVAPISRIEFPAADGLALDGYLTVPPGREARDLPLIVLAHGGPAAEDRLEFDWWGQAIASRGYAVLQLNFRGSTGRGHEFMEAGYGEWGRKMQTDLSDGVRYLAAQGIIDPERVCIMGASYGGYAALAGPTLDRGVYRCAVSVAGVSDLRRMVEYVAQRGTRRNNDSVRYWNRFMGAERLGDRSLDERSPARLADTADAPILLIHGRDDSVVPIEQSRMMASALRRAGKPVEFIELRGEDHWLSRGETRLQMLQESLRFLQANNPPD